MKKKIIILALTIISLTGCFKRDNMEDINIYTTIYPVKYLIESLYGNNANIYSIYPNGIDINEYQLTSKQLNDYSKSELFVFNARSTTERDYAVEMINKNKNLKIIDVSLGMNYENKIEELWLNPYNFLMMAENLKNGLKEYITNPYLIKEVEDNYETIQLKLSQLDAEIKETVKNSSYNTIITDDNLFKFLEKYGLNIIVINEDTTEKILNDTKKLINNNQIKFIYSNNTESNEIANNLITETGITKLNINNLYSIDGGITNSNQNYLTIMNDNIDLIKKELYK